MTAVEARGPGGAHAVPSRPPSPADPVGADGSPDRAGSVGLAGRRGPGRRGAPTRRVRGVVGWVGLALAAALGAGMAVDALTGPEGDADAAALGPGEVTVQVDVEHSLFRPEGLRVVEGTRVRFVVVNGDPIHHELIVGPPDVHARHAGGTEAEHPSIPGEVTVDPNGTAVTTFRFDEPGTFEFACHLPGHYEHGMHGEVEVVER